MDLESYHRDVTAVIDSVRKHVDPNTDLFIRKLKTQPSGTIATDCAGWLRTRLGFELEVRKELLHLRGDGSLERAYRYTMYKRGQELIRFQTTLKHPANAHFPPHYLSEDFKHFTIDRWPPHLREPDFLKMYKLFRDLVKAGGELPEPFRSAR